MSQPTKNKIPGPVYAAAGAGELAYEKLRKLPGVLDELSEKAAARTAELRERAKAAELRERATARTAGLREKATSGGAELRERAKTARGKATALYEDLVARGARLLDRSSNASAPIGEIESGSAETR